MRSASCVPNVSQHLQRVVWHVRLLTFAQHTCKTPAWSWHLQGHCLASMVSALDLPSAKFRIPRDSCSAFTFKAPAYQILLLAEVSRSLLSLLQACRDRTLITLVQEQQRVDTHKGKRFLVSVASNKYDVGLISCSHELQDRTRRTTRSQSERSRLHRLQHLKSYAQCACAAAIALTRPLLWYQ